MLGYFPTPLPDELFSSVVARFACHVGEPNVEALRRELTSHDQLDTALADLGRRESAVVSVVSVVRYESRAAAAAA